MIFQFGSGVLLGARTDVANSTPVNFGLIQEVQLDLSFTTKELYGQYQFPVAIARGTAKFTGKAKLAQISGFTFSSLFLGLNLAAGQVATAYGESQTVTSHSATVTNSATFVTDYGVINAATGLPYTKVTSAPAVGQYSVSAGVYTFNASDTIATAIISYTYTVSGSGQKIVMSNQLLGTTPTFQAQLYGGTYGGKPVNLALNNCVSSKLGYATKLEDFTIPEMDFSIFADASGNVATWSFAENS